MVAEQSAEAKGATKARGLARATSAPNRGTTGKSLDRAVDQQKRGLGNKPDGRAQAQPEPAPAAPQLAWTADKTVQARAVALGLTPGQRYEFQEAKGQSSWVVIGKDNADFIDSTGKKFLTLDSETMYEVVRTAGPGLPEAKINYRSAAKYRDHLVEEYYAYWFWNAGNSSAKNRIGSGKFRYQLAKQHLTDSVANELQHAAGQTGQQQLQKMLSHLADNTPGMECYGTTMLNVLKARGLIRPGMDHTDFEKRYAGALAVLPARSAHHVLKGGGGNAQETKATFETLVSRLSKLDWARFTGMSDRKATVKVLAKETEIEMEVRAGYTVFVQVPGHFKAAVGGTAGALEYDDPLGMWGHILYGGKPAVYGVVVE
jgi:hypothetical protein